MLSNRIVLLGLFICLLGLRVPVSFGQALEHPALEHPATEHPATETPSSPVVVLHLDGPIGGGLTQFVKSRLVEVERLRPKVLVLQINSPGGYLDLTYDILARLAALKHIKLVAYIPNEALSAAAITALACDEIIMHSDARIGDCGPIFLDEFAMFQHAPEKIRSELAVRVRELAASKKRPPALAEAMIDMNLAVYEVSNRETGERTFMSEAELAALADRDKWDQGPIVFESRPGNFLTATGQRAVELRIADAVVTDRSALLHRYSLSASVVEFRPTWVDTFVYVLNWPIITALLIIVGLTALYVEFGSPGIGLGGTLSFACFALFFWSRFLGGTSTWLEVIAFTCGVALVCLEIFVVPGLGIPGILGLALIVGSLVMAGQEFLIPESRRDWGQFANSLTTVAGSILACLVIGAVLSRYWKSVAIGRGLMLTPAPAGESTPGKPSSGVDETYPQSTNSEVQQKFTNPVAIGDWGVAVTQLCPGGKARFGVAFLDVISNGQFVESGQQVRVIELLGTRVVVESVESASG